MHGMQDALAPKLCGRGTIQLDGDASRFRQDAASGVETSRAEQSRGSDIRASALRVKKKVQEEYPASGACLSMRQRCVSRATRREFSRSSGTKSAA